MEEEIFFIIKFCRQHEEVSRILLQGHPQEKMYSWIKKSRNSDPSLFYETKV